MNEKRKVIGIDFGSTQSSIAIMEIGADSSPTLFTFDQSSIGDPMQTVLLLDRNDNHIVAVGNAVKWYADSHDCSEDKFVSDFKRHLGTDESKAAEGYTKAFLEELARQLESHESRALTPDRYATCIACPAAWTETQVNLLKKLVEQAGFPKDPTRGIYILREPVAAMRAHLIHYGKTPENFLVMDFGGGTLDVCVVETDIGGQEPIVRGIAGDSTLGGRDFDLLLLHHMEGVFKEMNLDYKSLSSLDKFRLDAQIRDAKRNFSDNFSRDGNRSELTLNVNWPGAGNLKLPLSKDVFRHLVAERGIDARIRKCVRAAIADSGLSPKQINRAVLTGGSSRWYFVRDIVKEECDLPDENERIVVSQTPFTDVAIGCAMSKARSGAPTEREGLWVKWRFDGEREWRGPKNLLRHGRTTADSEIRHQHLCEVPESRFWKPFRIEFSFWEGDEEWQNQPYQDGKHAVVDFPARSNHPLLKRPRDTINALRGRLDLIDRDFRDVYQCFLHCKEWRSGGPKFKLEIRDQKAGKLHQEEFDWDSPALIDIELGKLSRKGLLSSRKSVPWVEKPKTTPSLHGPSLLAKMKIPAWMRKSK